MVARLQQQASVKAVVFSPNGSLVATGSADYMAVRGPGGTRFVPPGEATLELTHHLPILTILTP